MSTPVRTLMIGPYAQEFAEVAGLSDGLPSPDVRALTIDGKGRLWAGTASGLAVRENNAWRAISPPAGLVNCLLVQGDVVWAGGVDGLYRVSATGESQQIELGERAGPVVALASDGAGRVFACCEESLRIVQGERVQAVPYPPPVIFPRDAEFVNGRLYIGASEGIRAYDGKEWQTVTKQESGLLSDDVRDLAVDSQGTMWVATGAGLCLFDGGKWCEQITGKEGLPWEDLLSVALGPGGVRWVGSTMGAMKLQEGEWHYYFGRRWLSGDEVRAIALGNDGTAWLGTPTGVSRVYTKTMTLEEKCAIYEEIIRLRHNRNGYVASCGLQRPGDLSSFIYEATDNDGLWTAIYVGAESFQYGATRDPQARELARESVYAMMDLEKKSTLEGFPARALVHKGERVIKSGGEWHDTADGKGEWKADTSSDELDGHYFAFAVYYDLVADEKEKEDLRGTVSRITDHIIEHGYYLVDVDGKPTAWGVFAPEMLNGPWEGQRGLNSLEMLSHLKVAYHVTGDEKYQAAYLDLVRNHHYALNIIYQKTTLPGDVNHSDDELAFLSYYPLVKYEDDPDLRAIYLRSLQRSWEIDRPERNPLWNFIYGALTGKDCDANLAVQTLQEIPTDMIEWAVRNSHRKDLPRDPEFDRFRRPQSLTPLRADERPIAKWNSNPFAFDGGGDGRGEDDGAYYLLPYWMGRYFRIIAEESR